MVRQYVLTEDEVSEIRELVNDALLYTGCERESTAGSRCGSCSMCCLRRSAQRIRDIINDARST